VIKSILDNDLYKFTMQLAVLELFPKAEAEYRFINRGHQRFSTEFVEELERIINKDISKLTLTEKEYYWLSEHCPYLKPMYLEYLKNFRFKPDEVKVCLTREKDLDIRIRGPWHSTILWEIVLMLRFPNSILQPLKEIGKETPKMAAHPNRYLLPMGKRSLKSEKPLRKITVIFRNSGPAGEEASSSMTV